MKYQVDQIHLINYCVSGLGYNCKTQTIPSIPTLWHIEGHEGGLIYFDVICYITIPSLNKVLYLVSGILNQCLKFIENVLK